MKAAPMAAQSCNPAMGPNTAGEGRRLPSHQQNQREKGRVGREEC